MTSNVGSHRAQPKGIGGDQTAYDGNGTAGQDRCAADAGTCLAYDGVKHALLRPLGQEQQCHAREDEDGDIALLLRGVGLLFDESL